MTHEVTNQGHDRDLLAAMAMRAKAVLKRDDLHILADKGYFSGREILACHQAKIIATVPRSDTSGARLKGHFVKADFAYEPDADVYRCPAGQALPYRTTTEQQGLQMRRTWRGGCSRCEIKSRCTTGHERWGALNTGFAVGARTSSRGIGCAPTQRRRADAGAKVNRRASVRNDQSLDRVLPFPDQAVSRGGRGNGVERAGLQHQENDLLAGHAGVDGCDPKLIAGKSAPSNPRMAPFEPEMPQNSGSEKLVLKTA